MNAPQTMGELIDQFEAELIAKDKAITPKQREIEEHRRKLQRQYEASITSIETDETRADKEEYPEEEEDK